MWSPSSPVRRLQPNVWLGHSNPHDSTELLLPLRQPSGHYGDRRAPEIHVVSILPPISTLLSSRRTISGTDNQQSTIRPVPAGRRTNGLETNTRLLPMTVQRTCKIKQKIEIVPSRYLLPARTEIPASFPPVTTSILPFSRFFLSSTNKKAKKRKKIRNQFSKSRITLFRRFSCVYVGGVLYLVYG